MKKIVKYFIIISLILANVVPVFAGANGVMVDIGAPLPGSRDDARILYETELKKGNITEERFYQTVMTGVFSPSVVAQILEDGYLTQYAENFKAVGLLSGDCVVKKVIEETAFTVNRISKTMYVKNSNKVAMYSGASDTYDTIGYLILGTKVEATGITEDDWYEVGYRETIGYVPGKFLSDTPLEYTISVSNNMVSTIEIDNTSDVPMLPGTHTYEELDVEAINALSVFMVCGIEEENYINIKSNARDKYVPGYLLDQTTQDNMSGTINFLDRTGKLLYSVVLKNYKVNKEIMEEYNLNIGADVEKGNISFAERTVLSTPMELTVLGYQAGEKYRIISESEKEEEREVVAGKKGELTFNIIELKSYQIKEIDQSDSVPADKDIQESKAVIRSKPYVMISVIGILLLASIPIGIIVRKKRK